MRNCLLTFCFIFLYSGLGADIFVDPFITSFNPDVRGYSLDGNFFLFDQSQHSVASIEEEQIIQRAGYEYVSLYGDEYLIIRGVERNILLFNTNALRSSQDILDVFLNVWPVIESASSSSYLTEVIQGIQRSYMASNLIHTVIDTGYGGIFWNIHSNPNEIAFGPNTFPWVEGVVGSGIGEWLEVRFVDFVSNLSVLNGYVDLLRPDLYEKNSRIKDATITIWDGEDSYSFDFMFEDIVKFQQIQLPFPSDHIRITIKSVYEGSEWMDTAVTGIFTDFLHPGDRYNATEKELQRLIDSYGFFQVEK